VGSRVPVLWTDPEADCSCWVLSALLVGMSRQWTFKRERPGT